jgi:hypothetical protein
VGHFWVEIPKKISILTALEAADAIFQAMVGSRKEGPMASLLHGKT